MSLDAVNLGMVPVDSEAVDLIGLSFVSIDWVADMDSVL